MGEYADYMIDQMMDDDVSPFSGKQAMRRGGKGKPPARFYECRSSGYDDKGQPVKMIGKAKSRKGKMSEEVRALEYPGAKTPAHLLAEYPEEKFNMGFFPVSKKSEPEKPDPWAIKEEEDSPF